MNARRFNCFQAVAASFILLLSLSAAAQFNSGSTGVDGALDLSTMHCPGNVCEVQVPESGVLNYTTVNVPGIPTHRTLRFRSNSRNTPVILLAQGGVVIQGEIDLSGAGVNVGPNCGAGPSTRKPGPGGFYGGQPDLPGQGPGAGQTIGAHAMWVGPLSLIPLVGGSGGAGKLSQYGTWGGSGGGAILIASSTSVMISTGARIRANGASDYSCPGGGFGYTGGSGSGGAIRVVANEINASGRFEACGISNNCGTVRLEAASLTFNGSSNPPAVLASVNSNTGTHDLPQLRITSVGGTAVPSYAGSRFDTVDILLPNQIPDPVPVVIQAVNIPSGAQVRVGFVSGSGNGTSTPCILSGSPGPLGCTATISNLARTNVTYLLATATFSPPAAIAEFNLKGKDNIASVSVESALGGKPKYQFLRSDGSVLETERVPREFRLYFGL